MCRAYWHGSAVGLTSILDWRQYFYFLWLDTGAKCGIKLEVHTDSVTVQTRNIVCLTGSMGIRRELRTADTSDSEDVTEDESVSGDAWTTRSGSGGGSVHAATTRTDVAVDYSITSSSHTSSAQCGETRPANTPRRHTGPRKRRVSEKVGFRLLYTFLCEWMTSSTKPEVHDILQCRQRRTEPWPQVICPESLVKFGLVVLEIYERTDNNIHTYMQ